MRRVGRTAIPHSSRFSKGTDMMSTTARRRLVVVVMALALSLTGATRAAAQGTGGSISGTAKDAQGGVLPGVTVTLRNEATGVTRPTGPTGSRPSIRAATR
jgi:hypothetical protein